MEQQQAEAVQEEIQEDKGLLGNAQAELNATREEPVGEPESIPHRADDVQAKIPDRPDHVPEKFWDKEQGKTREKEVFKSLSELEKKFSQGQHKAPENYDDKILVDAGYQKDDDIVGAYTEWAKENKISQKAYDDLAGKIIGMAGEREREEEFNSQEEMEKLGPNAKEIVNQNIEWVDGMERKKVFTEEKAEKIREFGKDALGNLILRDFRQMMGDLKPLPTVVAENTNETDEEFDARMQEMMNDERYINQDPSFTRKVEMEFERRHPD
tara:strand:+ start:2538 stop:3344 length:807 start_codon:yes stop_codon:yes gene_type:complete